MFVVHLDLALVHLRFAFLAEHIKLRCVSQKACQNFTIHLWFTNHHVKNIYNHLYISYFSCISFQKKSKPPEKSQKSILPENGFPPKKLRDIYYISFPQLEFNWISSFPSFFCVPHPKILAENPNGFVPQLGSDHFQMLPSEDFMGLDDYIELGNAFGENA